MFDNINEHDFLITSEINDPNTSITYYFSILTSEKNSCSLQGAKTWAQHRTDPNSVTMLVPTFKKTFSSETEGEIGMKNHAFKATNNYKAESEESLQKFKQEILKNKENFINFDFTEPTYIETKNDIKNLIKQQNKLLIDVKSQITNNDYALANILLANKKSEVLEGSLKQCTDKEKKVKELENDTPLEVQTKKSLIKSLDYHKQFQFKYSNKEIENFADTIIPIKNNIHNPSEKKNYSDDDNLE